MKKIILASASPRRRELLGQIGLEFEVIPGKGEEIITKQVPSEVVEELSFQKAMEVADQVCDAIVIGADTVVCQNGQIMGKPTDREDATRMLGNLQGNTHSVYTGVTVLIKDATGKIIASHTFSRKTKVHVNPMTEQEIQRYIDTGEPMDKAGGYGIQGAFAAWVESIEGDYNNVVGLPVSALWEVLKTYIEE